VAKVRGTSIIGLAGADVVVEIEIDDHGRMADYRIVQGSTVLLDPNLRRNLENRLMFTQFDPATSFGMPTRGTITLYLNYSRIEVKG
jgi:hypothetical protein